MKVILYEKAAGGGIKSVKVSETNEGEPRTAIERYLRLFHGVPLHGGREWQTLSVDDLVAVFNRAADEAMVVFRQDHDEEVVKHKSQSWLIRKFKELAGWRAPGIPSRESFVKEMIDRCLKLSDWMDATKSRLLYSGSDMTDFIDKPKAVASRLMNLNGPK